MTLKKRESVESANELNKAKLESMAREEAQKRAAQANAEIKAILEKYQCTIIAEPITEHIGNGRFALNGRVHIIPQ